MADIRCPMCGKQNPDGRQECQFCQARLTPLAASPFSDDSLIPLQDDGETESGLPDWLSAVRANTALEDENAVGDEGDEDPLDWLNHLQDDSETEADTALQNELETPLEADSASAEDGDDWLQRIRTLRDTDPLTAEADSAVPTPAEPESLPDWLTSEPEDSGLAIEGDSPAWTTSLGDAQPDAVPADHDPEAAATAEIPDWLSGLAPAEETAESNAVEESDLPAWMSDALSKETDREDIPDWITDLAGAEAEPILQEPISLGLADEVEVTDWLSEEGLEDFDIPDTPSLELESALNLGDSDEGLPDWLKNVGPGLGVPVETEYLGEEVETTSPFATGDESGGDLLDVDGLPDWLSSEADSIPGPGEISDNLDLSPAQLPGWLEAMRPAEAEISGGVEEDTFVESAGPLAGLKSVLAAEPDVAQIQVPPVYSARLEIDKNQLEHATLFEALLTTEDEAKPVPQTSLLSTQRVLRWLIAFILIVFVGFAVIAESQNVPLPAPVSIPDQTFAASKLVNAIPDSAPVLLAFDYEPGMAGEMHAASSAIVDRLIVKGSRLTLVSTVPSGPAIAEYFFQEVLARAYTEGKDYINLGYIPGGTTGLLSFAHTPRLVFPMSYDGNRDPWGTPPLQTVNRLSDFALVMIITDDSDVARAWIEQVQPQLGETPVITILSAQAEPMVRPYFGAEVGSQVRGIVSGLSGAAAYEVLAENNLGRAYWDAYSVGLIVAVGAIFIGGALNITSVILNRRSEDQEKNSP